MHSQLMFNECIARSIVKMSTSHVHNIPMSGYQIRSIDSVSMAYGRVELSYLPAADTEKEAQNIGLLFLLKLLDILEGTHLEIERSARAYLGIWQV